MPYKKNDGNTIIKIKRL